MKGKILKFLTLAAALCGATAWGAIATQEAFVEACANAVSGAELELGNGEFAIGPVDINGKTLTFKGQGAANTKVYIGNGGYDGNGGHGSSKTANMTFEDVTLDDLPSNSGYLTGFTEAAGLTFRNVTFNVGFSNWGNKGGDVSFYNCTFNQAQSDKYCVQELRSENGTKFLFDGCTFNCTGEGRFINAYKQGGAGAAISIVVKDCTFDNSKGSAKYGALYLKDDYNDGCNVNLTFVGTNTAKGEFPTTDTGSALCATKAKGHATISIQDTLESEPRVIYQAGAQTPAWVDPNGYKPAAAAPAVAKIGTTEYTDLAEAIKAAQAANDNVPVELLSDIDLTGKTWTSVVYSGGKLAIDGKGFTVKGLSAPLLNKQGSGSHELTMSNVTFKDATVSSTDDYAAVIVPYADSMNKLSFTNVTIDHAQVTSSKYAGAFVGYAAGYNVQNDGPVFQQVTFDNCKVKNSTITGAGSTGALMGHAAGNPNAKIIVRNGTTVQSNVITCSDTSSTDKAGSLFGTVGDCGNGYPEGGIEVAATVSGNTVTSGSTTITTIYGRRGSEGFLTLQPGGSYDAQPIADVDAAWAAPAEGYVVEKGTGDLWGVVEAAAPAVASITDGETTTKYETLKEAYAAAKDGDVIQLVAGEVDATASGTLSTGESKNVTIRGAGMGETVVNWGNGRIGADAGSDYVFEDLTLVIDHKGAGMPYTDCFWHPKSETFTRVQINGAISTMDPAVFDHCVFNGSTTGDEYLLYQYDSTLEVKNCRFVKAGSKGSIKLYAEAGNALTTVVTDCVFDAVGSKGSAIYTSNSNNAGETTQVVYDITHSGVTVPEGKEVVLASGNGVSVVNAEKDENGKYVSGLFLSANTNAETVEKIIANVAAENLVAAKEDGKPQWSLAPAKTAVAKIGDDEYETLAEAVAAATAGQTVTLLKDLADTGKISLKAGVTLDGDGHKVTGNSAVWINKAGGTVRNVVFEDIHDAASELSAVYARGLEGTATITGCTFDNCDWDAIQATPVAGAVLTITGNVFDTDNTDGVQQQRYVHIQSAANVDFTATVTGNVMKGDTKQGALEAYYFADEEKIDVSHNYIEDKADVCILDGTGALRNDKVFPAYKDAEKTELYQPVAMIATSAYSADYYPTLAAAAAAATDGKTITLISDVADAGNVSLKAGVTLDGYGHKVTGNSAVYINKAGGTVRNVVFEDIHNAASKRSAVYAEDLEGTATIMGCMFDNCDWDAIQATPVAGAELTITGNVFDTDNTDGVLQQRYVHIESAVNVDFTATVTGNVMKGDTKQGALEAYYFADEEKIDVSHNYIEDMADVCILDGTGALRNDMVFPAYKDAEKTELYQPVAMIATSAYSANYYPTLAEAVAAATAGQTITLLADVNVTEQVEVSDKAISLDLAGHTIAYTGTAELLSGVLLVHNGAGLTINDSSEGKSGKITSGENAYAAVAVTKKGDDAALTATLTVNAGTLTGRYFGITGNGTRHNTAITVKGGTITSTEGTGIYHPQEGTLKVTGGTVTGAENGIELRAGTLNVTGGEISSTANTFAVEGNGNGTSTVGAGIAISQHTTKKPIAVTVTGGTVSGQKSVVVANAQNATVDEFDVTVALNGGTFDNGLAVSGDISGATVTKDADTTVTVPSEYKWNDSNVLVLKTFVAQIGETKYETLEDAVGAATAGDTIVLIADVDLTQYGVDTFHPIVLEGVTLDLDGHTITANNGGVVYDGDNAVIRNGSFVCANNGSYAMFVGNEMYEGRQAEGVVIEDVTCTGGINVYWAKVTIRESNMGVTRVSGTHYYAVWGDEGALIMVKGGEFTSSGRSVIASFADSGIIEITGGTFTAPGNVKLFATEGEVSVSGGWFNKTVPEDVCAEGYVPSELTANGLYTVIENVQNVLSAVVDDETQMQVTIPEVVIFGKYGAAEGDTAEQTLEKKNAYMNSVEANGLKVWQNYVMGVDGSVAGNKLLTDYVVGGGAGDGEWITVKTPIAAFNPPTDSGITVKYRLLRTATPDDATSWQAFGELTDTPSFPVNIAGQEGDTFWKIEVVFQGEAANE